MKQFATGQEYAYEEDFICPASFEQFHEGILAPHLKHAMGKSLKGKTGLDFFDGAIGSAGRMYTKRTSSEPGEEGKVVEKEISSDVGLYGEA